MIKDEAKSKTYGLIIMTFLFGSLTRMLFSSLALSIIFTTTIPELRYSQGSGLARLKDTLTWVVLPLTIDFWLIFFFITKPYRETKAKRR